MPVESSDLRPSFRQFFSVLRSRHSMRADFDPMRSLPEAALIDLVEAARWSPTAHNMQNFELVVVDDPALLVQLGALPVPISETFVRENYRQLSFTRQQLVDRQVGIMADGFPPQWRDPNVSSDVLRALGPAPLANSLRGAPTVIVVTYDPRLRAPASTNDALGMMSLGCVMENIWLSAQALGIGVHIVSNVAEESVATAIKRMLSIPSHLNLAFAIALGYPKVEQDYLRVRRDVAKIVHRNRYRGH